MLANSSEVCCRGDRGVQGGGGPAACELPAAQRQTALWPDPGHCRLSPEELSVRQVGRKLRVSGKTEKKQEDGKGLNPEAVTCCLSPDRKLHIQAVKEEADRELSIKRSWEEEPQRESVHRHKTAQTHNTP
uniref:SHSP domain-containing protein n=1 Tax=Oryzias melastigma TaxID=30732 RepID=A0A3B3CMK7_ORYME